MTTPSRDEILSMEYQGLSGQAGVMADASDTSFEGMSWEGSLYWWLAGAGATPQPAAANVKLLCHFDGADGQTSTIDSSLNARTLTAVGGEALSTAQSKFGGASSVSAASGSKFWSAADSADWHFGSGQFTVEGWIYFTSAPTSVHSLVSQWPSTGNLGWFFGHVSGSLAFYYSTNSVDNPNVGASWTPVLNTWYHIAADRDASNVLRVYLNGAVHASATVSSAFFNSSGVLTVGGDTAWVGPAGYVDEVRIVKGEAVYGGSFSVPTEAFPNPTLPGSTARPVVFVSM